MLIQTIRVFVTIIALCIATDDPTELNEFLHKVSKGDISVFVNGYLSEAFAEWNKQYQIKSFRIDSVFHKNGLEEIWLSKGNYHRNNHHGIVLLLSTGQQRRIIEIRRLLYTKRQLFRPIENYVMEFLEKFIWIYEIGTEGFIQDLLYWDYIKVYYQGLSSSKDVIQRLRSKNGNFLPIQSVSWEGKYPNFRIQVFIDSPFKPLEIIINLEQYLTTQYFKISDKYDRVSSLIDSLKVWLTSKNSEFDYSKTHISSFSSRMAIRECLQLYFGFYNIQILDTTATSSEIEAKLAPIYGLAPATLKFQLETREIDTNKYEFSMNWHPDETVFDYLLMKEKIKNKSRIISLSKLISTTVLRFSSLGLPESFRPRFDERDKLIGELIIHHTRIDTINWQGTKAFQNILHGLSKNKLIYYFPSNFMYNHPITIFQSYAIWKDKQLLYHHVAKLEDIYYQQKKDIGLKKVIIHLYPYIRTDNVRNIFTESDTTTYNRVIIEPWR